MRKRKLTVTLSDDHGTTKLTYEGVREKELEKSGQLNIHRKLLQVAERDRRGNIVGTPVVSLAPLMDSSRYTLVSTIASCDSGVSRLSPVNTKRAAIAAPVSARAAIRNAAE